MILHNCKCCTHLSKGEALWSLTMYYPVKVEHPPLSLRLTGSLIPRCHLSQSNWFYELDKCHETMFKKKRGKSNEKAVELKNGNNFQHPFDVRWCVFSFKLGPNGMGWFKKSSGSLDLWRNSECATKRNRWMILFSSRAANQNYIKRKYSDVDCLFTEETVSLNALISRILLMVRY